MHSFRDLPIRRQLMLMILITLAASLLLVMAGIVVYDIATYRNRLAAQMTEAAGFIAANSAPALAFDDPRTGHETLVTLEAYPAISVAALYTTDGRVFATFDPDRPSLPLPPDPPPAGLRYVGRQLEIVHPVEQRGRLVGTLYLLAETELLGSRLAPYAGILLAVALAIGGGAFLLQRLLQRRVSEPLLQLSRTAERVAGGDLEVRARVESGDEIGQLAAAFNHMATELAQSRGELERRVEERTAELSAANRELEVFTYTVSHDLRAPLRHIAGFVELLKTETGPKLDNEAQRYIAVIAGAAGRMEKLIDDLLTFSRLGRASLAENTVDFAELAQEVRRELAPETTGRTIDWRIGSLPKLRGDPVLLRTALANLLANAIKYTRGREPARIEIGSRQEGAEMIIFVRDNGAGFDMRFADKLFGIFQRLHRAEEFEGTGIGLASVQRIVQRHGGRTWAEGAVDRGATFYLALPAQRLNWR